MHRHKFTIGLCLRSRRTYAHMPAHNYAYMPRTYAPPRTDRFTATDWWRLSPPLRTRRPPRAVGDPQRRGAITACTPIRIWASGSTSVAAPSGSTARTAGRGARPRQGAAHPAANRFVEYAMAQRRHSIGASLCTSIRYDCAMTRVRSRRAYAHMPAHNYAYMPARTYARMSGPGM
jgi:hypothetical protein